MVTRRYLHHDCNVSRRLLSVLVLAGIALSGATSLRAVAITPVYANTPVGADGQSQRDRLPDQVADAVRQDLARRVGISAEQLRLVQYNPETWSDDCLEFPPAGNFCVLAPTDGWRVTVASDRASWTYRTDATGQTVRAESLDAVTLPQEVTDRVLAIASQDFAAPASELQIAQAEPKTWNGCLGIAPGLNGACTEIAISGWRVIVTSDRQSRVYHTNGNGSDIRLNAAASQVRRRGGALPTFLSADAVPAPLENMVFRAIASGGITGQTCETVLMRDGRVLQSRRGASGAIAQTELRQLSPQQVEQFEQVLTQQQFMNFDRLAYRDNTGADYITITLTGRGSTTQYIDTLRRRLPQSLRQVINSWNRTARSRC